VQLNELSSEMVPKIFMLPWVSRRWPLGVSMLTMV
jgi:hypothetical protein